jgi:predicted esterase
MSMPPDAVPGPPPPGAPEGDGPGPRRWSRRRLLSVGLGGAAAVVVAGVTGFELVSHGVLPGQQRLDELDGACSVEAPELSYSTPGPSTSGTFFSSARNRTVGYTIAWPPGHPRGAQLPLVVMLHGFGGNHTDALAGMSPAQAVALHVAGRRLPPMAMVTVDGGGGYWNPHPGDDPMAMVVDELIPMCQALGLGRAPHQVGTMGISMGGYGALLLAERYPHLIGAAAAISPAIWTSYPEARLANPGAYASAGDFAANDAVTLAPALRGTPVRLASGDDDPFRPGVEALVRVLPPTAEVEVSKGCHTAPFFLSQEPPSLSFLGRHLT